MPIHDVGYREWNGKKTPQHMRFSIITETGIRLALKSRWVRRMLFFAWLPVMYWGVAFFVIEQNLERQSIAFNQTMVAANMPDAAIEVAGEAEEALALQRKVIAKGIKDQFRMIPSSRDLAEAVENGDEDTTRNIIWSWLLMTFFRYPQALLILFLLGSITPRLISRDLRSRAFLLYFARPIGKTDYILGKLLIPIAFIIFVTTLPALALYFFAILMSPDFGVFWSTWDIPIRIVAATVVLVVPTSSLALMLSSLTHESRFASFAWFAIWALGHGAWLAIVIAVAIQMEKAPFDHEVLYHPTSRKWSMLSLYNNLGEVQSWIFGFNKFQDVIRGVTALAITSIFCLTVLYRRVSAPIRI